MAVSDPGSNGVAVADNINAAILWRAIGLIDLYNIRVILMRKQIYF